MKLDEDMHKFIRTVKLVRLERSVSFFNCLLIKVMPFCRGIDGNRASATKLTR